MSGTPAARRPVRIFVLGASLRKESLNVRLAGAGRAYGRRRSAPRCRPVDFHDLAVPPFDTDVLEADGVAGGRAEVR